MKLSILLPILFILTISSSYADFKSDVADKYAKGVDTILFFASEDIIT